MTTFSVKSLVCVFVTLFLERNNATIHVLILAFFRVCHAVSQRKSPLNSPLEKYMSGAFACFAAFQNQASDNFSIRV